MHPFLVALCITALVACSKPPGGQGGSDAEAPGCTRVGERCEFSPGKLGMCVSRDDCIGSNCLVCQSQH